MTSYVYCTCFSSISDSRLKQENITLKRSYILSGVTEPALSAVSSVQFPAADIDSGVVLNCCG